MTLHFTLFQQTTQLFPLPTEHTAKMPPVVPLMDIKMHLPQRLPLLLQIQCVLYPSRDIQQIHVKRVARLSRTLTLQVTKLFFPRFNAITHEDDCIAEVPTRSKSSYETLSPATCTVEGKDVSISQINGTNVTPIAPSTGPEAENCLRTKFRCEVFKSEKSMEDDIMKWSGYAKKYFNIDELKKFQVNVLSAWSKGEDTLIVQSTSSGKSLCFQLPALLESSKTVLVIIPTTSLAEDEAAKMKSHGINVHLFGATSTEQCFKSVFDENDKR